MSGALKYSIHGTRVKDYNRVIMQKEETGIGRACMTLFLRY
jgi:hypothetical protein